MARTTATHNRSPPIAAGSNAVTARPATPRNTTRRSSVRQGRRARSRRRSAEVRPTAVKVASTMFRFGGPFETPRARTARRASALLFALSCLIHGRAAIAAEHTAAPNPFSLAPAHVVATGDIIPSGAFVDQTGAARTLDDFRGSTVVI